MVYHSYELSDFASTAISSSEYFVLLSQTPQPFQIQFWSL